MAVLLVKRAATPLSLKYEIQSSGAGAEAFTLLNATLQADAVAGPLLELLKATYASQAAARAAFVEAGNVRVSSINRTLNGLVLFDVNIDGGMKVEWTIGTGNGPGIGTFFLEYKPQLQRSQGPV